VARRATATGRGSKRNQGKPGGSAYATASPKLVATAVGVAIATALVPPLTTCGILIARGLPTLAAGAFLLFLANLIAIAFSGMVTFMILGHRTTITGPWSARAASAIIPRFICVGLLLVLGGHLFKVFHDTLGEANLRTSIRQLIESELLRSPESRLVDVTIRGGPGPKTAFAVVRAPRPFLREEVGRINDSLNSVIGQPIDLHIRSVLTIETTRDGTVAPAEVLRPNIRPGRVNHD
jgi:uncharacterized membrane protein